MPAAPTRSLLLSALVITLAGGCATARPDVTQGLRRSCIRTAGHRFTANVCLLRDRPAEAGAVKAPPKIWVGIFSWDSGVADLGLWQVTVLRAGKVVSHGHFLNMPTDACESAGLLRRVGGQGFCSDDVVKLPGMQWQPGSYRVKLTWSPDPAQHFEFQLRVPAGSGAPGSEQGLPPGEMLVKA